MGKTAAASSSASGNPSSRAHSVPTADALVSVSTNVGLAARARSANRRMASYWSARAASSGTSSSPGSQRASAGTCQATSPSIASGSRLVAMIVRCGAPRRSASAICAASWITCSQLSRTIRKRCGRSASTIASIVGFPDDGVISSRPASVLATSTPLVTGASSTQSMRSGDVCAAADSESRTTAAATSSGRCAPAGRLARRVGQRGRFGAWSRKGRRRIKHSRRRQNKD